MQKRPQDDVVLSSAEPAADEVAVNWPFPDSWSGQEEAWRLLLEEVAAWSDTESTRDASTSGALAEDEALLSAWRMECGSDRRPGQDALRRPETNGKRRISCAQTLHLAASAWTCWAFECGSRSALAGEVIAELGSCPNGAERPVGSDEVSPSCRHRRFQKPPSRLLRHGWRLVRSKHPLKSRSRRSPAVSRARFGVLLPDAEVVGAGASPSDGFAFGPLSGRDGAGDSGSRRLDEPGSGGGCLCGGVGAPAEGVEYKVQIGAFRNPLPAALFAAFDPMWAKTRRVGLPVTWREVLMRTIPPWTRETPSVPWDTRMPLSCASWMENGSAAPVLRQDLWPSARMHVRSFFGNGGSGWYRRCGSG